jgi:hypothetical protein
VKDRISTRQLLFLQLTTIAPTALIFLPGLVLAAAGHDAPWALLASIAVGLALDTLLVYALVPLSPPELFTSTFGTAAGRLATLLYALLLAIGLVAIWAEFLILIQSLVLPLTPSWATGLLAAAVAGVLVSRGPTAIARLNDLVVPFTVAVVTALLFAATLRVKTWNLLPWLPSGSGFRANSVWLPVTFLGEVPTGAAFLAYVRRTGAGHLRRALLAGVMAAALALFGVVVISLGALGPVLSRELAFPFFEVISEIRIGDFLTKNAVWLIAVGSLLLYVKIAIWVFAIADACRAAVRRGPRSLWAWGVIVATLAGAVAGYTSVTAATKLVTDTWAHGVFPLLAVLVVTAGVPRLRQGIRVRT